MEDVKAAKARIKGYLDSYEAGEIFEENFIERLILMMRLEWTKGFTHGLKSEFDELTPRYAQGWEEAMGKVKDIVKKKHSDLKQFSPGNNDNFSNNSIAADAVIDIWRAIEKIKPEPEKK